MVERRSATCSVLLMLVVWCAWPSAFHTRAAAGQPPAAAPQVTAVDAVGMTVADMDRSVAFFSTVLPFQKVSDVEVSGEDYERLEGVFGLRMRVVRVPGDLGFTQGLSVHDPDGHVLNLIER